MNEYDLVVLGGGTGNVVAAQAADEGLSVALVEKGPLGGTCLNRGCNPSKQLVHRADVAETIRTADGEGLSASLEGVAFGEITASVNDHVTAVAAKKRERARERENVALYGSEGRFVGERTFEVGGGDRITGENVVIAGGTRPRVPDVDGLEAVSYLTSDEALTLSERPDHLVIVGGGYVAVEMAHFYGELGTDVTIVGSADRLAPREDADVAERLTDAYARKYAVHTGYRATAVSPADGGVTVRAESEAGEVREATGDELLIATGRVPNTDTWNVEAGGVETDDDGFVETNEYLETSAENVWAIGDIAGNYMFKHSGDKEAEYALTNAVRGERIPVEHPGMAHAIYGSPRLAALGRTESELAEEGIEYRVGTAEFTDVPLGVALDADDGLAKVLVGDDGEVLGCHLVGPRASLLIHEVSAAVSAGADAEHFTETIHVHPALNEVLEAAFRDALDASFGGL